MTLTEEQVQKALGIKTAQDYLCYELVVELGDDVPDELSDKSNLPIGDSDWTSISNFRFPIKSLDDFEKQIVEMYKVEDVKSEIQS